MLDLLEREASSCIPDISSTFSTKRSSSSACCRDQTSFATRRPSFGCEFVMAFERAALRLHPESRMTPPRPGSRRAGVLIPLFSIPSSRSWGIGEIGDIEAIAALARCRRACDSCSCFRSTKCRRARPSPYSALSAMAIDPQFITLDHVEDFAEIGGEEALEPPLRARLDAARIAPRIQYAEVRELKNRAAAMLRAVSATSNWRAERAAPRISARTSTEQAWWLDDYALFRALHARTSERAWIDWPEPLRSRQPDALDARPRGAGG